MNNDNFFISIGCKCKSDHLCVVADVGFSMCPFYFFTFSVSTGEFSIILWELFPSCQAWVDFRIPR